MGARSGLGMAEKHARATHENYAVAEPRGARQDRFEARLAVIDVQDMHPRQKMVADYVLFRHRSSDTSTDIK